jgi:uncharacterized protein YcbK (DUF882 family)
MVRTPNLFAPAAIGRRAFLRRLAAAGVGVAAARGAWAAEGESRTVSFLHTHTGEQLTANYYADGAYCAGVLQQVNVLLRDFRNDTVFPIDPALLDRLYALQAATGGSEPFQVISGYRSAATNAALREKSSGVAEHSLHMDGRAIDVRLTGVASDRLALLARLQSSGGVGFYRVSDFVHLDTGRVRIWGDSIAG